MFLHNNLGFSPNSTDHAMHVLTRLGYVGGCQYYDPFLGTLNSRCRTIIGTQKRIIILTTTHVMWTEIVPGARTSFKDMFRNEGGVSDCGRQSL